MTVLVSAAGMTGPTEALSEFGLDRQQLYLPSLAFIVRGAVRLSVRVYGLSPGPLGVLNKHRRTFYCFAEEYQLYMSMSYVDILP